MKFYSHLINRHNGVNSYIFGAGPSLWKAMNDPFFKEIPNYGITIAVNSAVMAVPNFDYWVSNDALCRRWSWWKDVKDGSGIKIVRDSWLKYKKELKDFLFFPPRPTSEGVINPDDFGLSYCSSVPSAIDLALQMGAKKIFVFGLDHASFNGRHHFWQFMETSKQPTSISPEQGAWEQQKKVFKINNLAFKALKIFADSKDAEIYNVSDITKVDIFKTIDMEKLYEYAI